MSNLTDFFPGATGGSGGTAIGGFEFIAPPSATTFVTGQEVYTAADGKVWIRTAAQLTDAGSGALDASIYPISSNQPAVSSTSFSGGAALASRGCFGYNGVHLGVLGLFSGTQGKYILVDENNVTISSGSPTSGNFSAGESATGWVFGQNFYNDTHAFTGFDRLGTNSYGTAERFAYQPFTAFTGGTNGYTQTNYFTAPRYNMAVTNIETTPRYWGVDDEETTVYEYTFNASAANGSDPFTATGTTFTLAEQCTRFMSDGVDKLYVHNSTNLKEYNTSGVLTNSFSGLPSTTFSTQFSNFGISCVPGFKNSTGNTQFWATTSIATSSTTQTLYNFPLLLTAPFTGTPSSKVKIVAQDVDSNPILPETFLYQRIA
tara:strand:+ start:161 stop:1282 length:1122 start_codon:yes stop_codon:yes gene_type:complete